MQKRGWLAVLVGLAMLGVCAAMLVALWGGYTWTRAEGLRWRVVASDTVSVESDEERRFAVNGPATLDLTNHVGDVAVTAGDTNEIVVNIHRTAWGSDEAEAQARLAALLVNASQAGSVVTLEVPDPPGDVVAAMGERRSDSVAFTIVVPVETAVVVRTEFGEVTLAGTRGPVELRTGAGALAVQRVTGSVTARSDFGEVVIEEVAGESVVAGSGSGALRLRQVAAAGPVELTTDFGTVVFENGEAATLTARTGSGPVSLTDLAVAGQVSVEADFGDVTLAGVSASTYDVHSGSGTISVDGGQGTLTADSDFGEVKVLNALSATVDLRSGSGGITFSGELGAGPHVLQTHFGGVTVSVPAGTGLGVDLSTDFGSINSDFPLTVAGDLDDDHWQGEINGGGPSLTVSTGSGSIALQQLP
jgi:DUF4097 and DUF4098 domain-containing protein YvlB